MSAILEVRDMTTVVHSRTESSRLVERANTTGPSAQGQRVPALVNSFGRANGRNVTSSAAAGHVSHAFLKIIRLL